jgi:hypothetical protein
MEILGRFASNDVQGADVHKSGPDLGNRVILGFVILLALTMLIYPTARAFYHFEVNYNEGWNLYNTETVAHHIPTYGAKYNWTTVNYPLLSYYVVHALSRLTHDDLLTGRLLSLFSMGLSCVLVGLIVKRLTGNLASALFGGFFCLALFCTIAPSYVGANDPQIFAQVFFLAGFLIYVRRPPRLRWLATVALLFAVGCNIKHNLIDFPLAVLLDLSIVSRRKAAQFALFSGALACISVAANISAGGPYFISNLLAGRSYFLLRALLNFLEAYVALLFPLIVACIWAGKERNSSPNRILSIFFFLSLFVGIALGGGEGVSVNSYFDNFLAISMIVGILFHSVLQSRGPDFRCVDLRKWGFAGLLLSGFLIAATLSGTALFWRRIAELPREQAQFDREVSFIASLPGPTVCESLLRCYAAEKPYVYDPFNCRRFIESGKLDSDVIVSRIASRQYASIQISLPVKSYEGLTEQLQLPGFHPIEYSTIQLGPYGELHERFPEDILKAIDTYYVLATEDPNCDIYVPRWTYRLSESSVRTRRTPLGK